MYLDDEIFLDFQLKVILLEGMKVILQGFNNTIHISCFQKYSNAMTIYRGTYIRFDQIGFFISRDLFIKRKMYPTLGHRFYQANYNNNFILSGKFTNVYGINTSMSVILKLIKMCHCTIRIPRQQ